MAFYYSILKITLLGAETFSLIGCIFTKQIYFAEASTVFFINFSCFLDLVFYPEHDPNHCLSVITSSFGQALPISKLKECLHWF